MIVPESTSSSSFTPPPAMHRHASHFWSGVRSGAFSGALMVGILTVVGLAFGVGTMALPAMGVLIISTSLFGGIMAMKRGHHADAAAASFANAPVAAIAQTPTLGHAVQPAMEHAETAPAPAPSWVTRTGQADAAPSRLKQILDNGALSDAGRAQAILAEREQAAQPSPTLGA